MPKYTDCDFANYRNLGRRAESAGDADDELRYLNKCVEIYEWRKGACCSVDTFIELVNRINKLNADRIAKARA